MNCRYVYLVCLLFLASCSSNIYSPALFKHNIAYQPKPMTFDQKKNATYLSGSLGLHQMVNLDNVEFGEISISRGHTFQKGNLSIGAFGFAGRVNSNYNAIDSMNIYRFKNLSFEGFGLRASGNFSTSFGRTNWRFLGFEAAYSKEFGAYSNFRNTIFNKPGYYTTLSSSVFTAGLTTEIIWHSKSSVENQYGFRVFIGRNFGDLSYINNLSENSTFYRLSSSNSFFMQLHHINICVETNGFLSLITSLRVSAGYRF